MRLNLLTFVAFGVLFVNAGASALTISLNTIPAEFKPLEIKTAPHYIVYNHFIVTLVEESKHGDMIARLAESWDVNESSTKYTFEISKKYKWSDGSPVSASDVVKHFEYAASRKTTVHSDFSILKRTWAKGNQVFFELNEPNTRFLHELSRPEAGILKPDLIDKENLFAISSGPYFLKEIKNDSIILKRNMYFPSPVKDYPAEVAFVPRLWAELKPELKSGKVDVALAPFDVSLDGHNEIMKSSAVKLFEPFAAFSFFLTINPYSKKLEDLDTRKFIQSIIKPGTINFGKLSATWSASKQLYLEDSPGRANKEWLDAFWTGVSKSGLLRPAKAPTELRILLRKGVELYSQIEILFKKAGIKLIPVTYTDMEEAIKLRSDPDAYDIAIRSNEFSGGDVLDNLVVTFTSAHRIIPLPESSKIPDVLEKAKQEPSLSKRFPMYESIGKEVLEQAYISPLAYSRIMFYYQPHLDLSEWTKLYPELTAWKIKTQKAP